MSINIRNHNRNDFFESYNARSNFRIFLNCLYSFDIWQYIFSSLKIFKKTFITFNYLIWDENQQRVSSLWEILLMRTLQHTYSEHYLLSADYHESQYELYTWRKNRSNQVYKWIFISMISIYNRFVYRRFFTFFSFQWRRISFAQLSKIL